MSSPGIRPRNNKPAAGGHARTVDGKKGPQKTLRVMPEEAAARAVPSIAMPRAKTELTEILAGDDLLCVRRPRTATALRPTADTVSSVPGVDVEPRAESPRSQSGDGDLAGVIDAWPGLPRNVRAAILAMIRETAAGDA